LIQPQEDDDLFRQQPTQDLAITRDEEQDLRTQLIALIVIIALFCIRAALSSTFNERSGKRLTIAVVPMATTDEYWKSIHAGAIKAARELNVDILWQGPVTYDRNAQLDIMETMIVRKVDAIAMAPIDRNAARAVAENAARSGIPVVVLDSDLNSKRQISFIATDNYKAGCLACRFLCEKLGKHGNIIMLRGVAGNASVDNRESGFLDTLKDYPQITILSSNQRIGAAFDESFKSAENLLARFAKGSERKPIDGIFCPNETSTFAMLRALESESLIGTIPFVGFDTSRKLNNALYAHKINCLVVQDPMRMGYLGIKTAVDNHAGRNVEPLVDTGVILATPENAKDPKIHALLEPDLARWLN
jgi:ribose transport system substrate-binding protein